MELRRYTSFPAIFPYPWRQGPCEPRSYLFQGLFAS